MTECFWCYCEYDNTKLARCPECQSETNTGAIVLPSICISSNTLPSSKKWNYSPQVRDKVCIHGLGHSDEDHGCDGCCTSETP